MSVHVSQLVSVISRNRLEKTGISNIHEDPVYEALTYLLGIALSGVSLIQWKPMMRSNDCRTFLNGLA